MSSVRPVKQEQRLAPSYNENLPHYGVLMGGPKEIKLEGIGEASVGHLSIPRRALAEFTRLQVGRKNESEAAMADDRPAMHIQWFNNPDRITVKSPKQCAIEVFALFGDQGFVIPLSLVGKGYNEAVELFNSVMPRSGQLHEVIRALSSVSYEDGSDKERLRGELLEGASVSNEYLVRYTTGIASEVLNAPKTGKGKGGFDQLDIEYFRELGKPLPEELPALANAAMGKEIAASIKPGVSEDLLKAVLEQNQLLIKQLAEDSRQASAVQPTEPASNEAAGTTKGE